MIIISDNEGKVMIVAIDGLWKCYCHIDAFFNYGKRVSSLSADQSHKSVMSPRKRRAVTPKVEQIKKEPSVELASSPDSSPLPRSPSTGESKLQPLTTNKTHDSQQPVLMVCVLFFLPRMCACICMFLCVCSQGEGKEGQAGVCCGATAGRGGAL